MTQREDVLDDIKGVSHKKEKEKKLYMFRTSRQQKYRVIASVIAILACIGFLYYVYKLIGVTHPDILVIESYVKSQIMSVTPVGLFILSGLGAFFFLPIPTDILYFTALAQGMDPKSVFIMVMLGSLIFNYFNYLLGWQLSNHMRYLISVKQLYEAKRWVNKYGAWAVFIFNLTPLPGSVLTFALGITRYNLWRLYIFYTLGNALKYGLYIAIFSLA
jgi:membrane protein YqaA with SNARE-associated domain